MKLGFDIDDTLINLREHAFHIYNKNLQQTIPIEVFYEIKKVEIHEAFGLTASQGSNMWKNSLEEIYFTSCPPYPDAIEILQELNEKGHEIYYITARPKSYGERTKQWMKDQGFPVREDRFFCGMKDEEKVDIIRTCHLDYYFDDKPDVLNTLSNEKLNVFVKNQPYNQHLTIPRISNWSELKDLINKG